MSTGLAETPWHVERIGHDPPGETNVIVLQSGRAEADALCFALPGLESIMEAFLTSAGLVALAEMGDKTQLLAMLLVARFRQPWPIAAGILAATLANHFLAALVGHEVAGLLDALWFRILVALGFVGMGLWMLVPDKLDEDEAVRAPARAGVLLTTLIAFFLAEIGDKTQIATVALSAHFSNIAAVTAGTTIGMMIANVPVLFLGEALLRRIPLRPLQLGAALLFVLLGLWALGVALNVLPG